MWWVFFLYIVKVLEVKWHNWVQISWLLWNKLDKTQQLLRLLKFYSINPSYHFYLIIYFTYIFFSETGSWYVDKAGLKLMILLPHPPESWIIGKHYYTQFLLSLNRQVYTMNVSELKHFQNKQRDAMNWALWLCKSLG
jgi:hypothetical protein